MLIADVAFDESTQRNSFLDLKVLNFLLTQHTHTLDLNNNKIKLII